MSGHPAWKVWEREVSSLPLDLLLQADPSEKKVCAYLRGGRGFVVEDEGLVVGVCVVVDSSGGVPEVRNVSVAWSHQRRGVGIALLRRAITAARERGGERLEVRTGSFGYQLAFYQKAGFRVVGVDRDFFVRNYEEPIIEDGIRLRDCLLLEMRLRPPSLAMSALWWGGAVGVWLIAASILLVGVLLVGAAVMGLIDPLGAQMANDADPFGTPPGVWVRLQALALSVGVVLLGGALPFCYHCLFKKP